MSESRLTGKEPCPKCNSRDNLARYDDGHAHCFTPGCGHWEPAGDGDTGRTRVSKEKTFEPLTGEVKELGKRKLTQETCEKWKYEVGEKSGKTVQIANYFDRSTGEHVGQKIRFPDKTFTVTGKISDHLFGAHLWGDSGKMIVITEGEIDALSVSQAQGNKWPVVSIPNGAQSAGKVIAKNISWLEAFETVVLMFDNDDPGRQAVEEVVSLFSPGKVKVAALPLKDASDMVQAGREKELIDAIWRAKQYRPDGIVSVDDVIEQALKPIEVGLPWFFPTLTKLTYGRRPGEVYMLGAGTGVGKTDFLSQQIAFDIEQGEHPVTFFLEQAPAETIERVAGKIAKVPFHVPDAGWTEQQRADAMKALRGKYTMYDAWGGAEWDVIKEKIRYLAVAEGRRIFYLDHLTALADPSNERESLEVLMKELASLTHERRLVMTVISHLSTPEGKSHEEGGRVMIKHFKGARAIGFWSHYMFGLERNQQAESEDERKLTTFRILKDRKTGRATGKTFHVTYDFETALLSETDDYFPDTGGKDF